MSHFGKILEAISVEARFFARIHTQLLSRYGPPNERQEVERNLLKMPHPAGFGLHDGRPPGSRSNRELVEDDDLREPPAYRAY